MDNFVNKKLILKTMEDPNFEFLNSKFHISKEAYTILQGLATYKKLKQGEILVEQGANCDKMFFIVSGLLRAYHVLESGKEITKNLYTPFSFVGPFSSIVKKETSFLTIDALVESSVYVINFKTFLEYAKTNIEMSNIYNRILENIFIVYEKKYMDYLRLNATERYKILKLRIPNIDNLIPQYQIASYLNITPVQLSRLKKDL